MRLVLLVPILLQIVIAVVLTGYFSWRNGQKTVDDLASHLSREITAHVEDHIQSYTEIPPLLMQINKLAVENGNLDVNNYPVMTQYFWNQTQLSPAAPYMYFANSAGDFVGVWREIDQLTTLRLRTEQTAPNREIYRLDRQGNRQELLRQETFDPRIRPWYRVALASQQPTWSDIYVFAYPPRLGMTYASPVYDDANSLLGVLAIDLTLADISKFLQQLHVSQAGQVFIIERSGNLVASSTIELPFVQVGNQETRLASTESDNPLIRETTQALITKHGNLANLTTDKQFIHSIAGQHQFIQAVPFSPQPGLDWLIVVVIPRSEFTDYIQANNYTTLTICFLTLVIASILAIVTAQWIARPLHFLSKISESFAQRAIATDFMENKTFSTPVSSVIREVQLLALAFNNMSQQLRTALQDLANNNAELEQRIAQRTEELEAANKELQQYATIDSLTQVANRRRFDEYLDYVWRWLIREQQPLALIFCDVDYFKLYNDTYGHPVGDSCLQQIAKAMLAVAERPTDLVARYGGEEFAIILPKTQFEGAVKVAEQLQQHIQQLNIPHSASEVSDRVTVSIGVAWIFPHPHQLPKTLVTYADQSLYEAKAQGRDQIISVCVVSE
ncbi:MAG: diguanylate cyclase [Cyanobacteria bacterium P01_D01_bin.156]